MNKINYYNKIKNLLHIIPHKYRVIFAIYCAESVTKNLDKDTKDTKDIGLEAITAAKAWVKNPSEENRLNAYSASHSASHSAVHSAHSAHSAAYSATSAASSAAYSAYSAYSAAYSAASAASSAAYSAYSAYSAASAYSASHSASHSAAASAYSAAYREEKFKEQYQYLVKHICNFTKLEKLVYDIK